MPPYCAGPAMDIVNLSVHRLHIHPPKSNNSNLKMRTWKRIFLLETRTFSGSFISFWEFNKHHPTLSVICMRWFQKVPNKSQKNVTYITLLQHVTSHCKQIQQTLAGIPPPGSQRFLKEDSSREPRNLSPEPNLPGTKNELFIMTLTQSKDFHLSKVLLLSHGQYNLWPIVMKAPSWNQEKSFNFPHTISA